MKYGIYWNRGQCWCLIGFANTYDEAINVYRKGCADGHDPFIVKFWLEAAEEVDETPPGVGIQSTNIF